MYYGYYSNSSLSKSCEAGAARNVSASNASGLACTSQRQQSYKMPLAYFFTIQMAFFITCIILVYRCGSLAAFAPRLCPLCIPGVTSVCNLCSDSMSKSFGQSFRIDKSHSILAIKVFCSWDFKVIKKTSVRLMSENICTQLKVFRATQTQTRTHHPSIFRWLKLHEYSCEQRWLSDSNWRFDTSQLYYTKQPCVKWIYTY